jgi:hypothetical protein
MAVADRLHDIPVGSCGLCRSRPAWLLLVLMRNCPIVRAIDEKGQLREFAALPRMAARPPGAANWASPDTTFCLQLNRVGFVAKGDWQPWAMCGHPGCQGSRAPCSGDRGGQTFFAMSRPMVAAVCMSCSSESWSPHRQPLPWRSRAGWRSRPQHQERSF